MRRVRPAGVAGSRFNQSSSGIESYPNSDPVWLERLKKVSGLLHPAHGVPMPATPSGAAAMSCWTHTASRWTKPTQHKNAPNALRRAGPRRLLPSLQRLRPDLLRDRPLWRGGASRQPRAVEIRRAQGAIRLLTTTTTPSSAPKRALRASTGWRRWRNLGRYDVWPPGSEQPSVGLPALAAAWWTPAG